MTFAIIIQDLHLIIPFLSSFPRVVCSPVVVCRSVIIPMSVCLLSFLSYFHHPLTPYWVSEYFCLSITFRRFISFLFASPAPANTIYSSERS